MNQISYLAFFFLITTGCSLFKPKTKTTAMPVEKEPVPIPVSDNRPFPEGKTDVFLTELLSKEPSLAKILNSPKDYQTQILYTRIDRNNNNKPSFSTFSFNADPDFYFYPASVVKMPVAFLALQKINELNEKGIPVTKEMTMITEVGTPFQTGVYNDPASADGRPTIANYIKKIFLVSDNDAFNRLYEFLGQEYINSNLQKMGYKSAEIIHRLSLSLSPQENSITNPVKFFGEDGKLVYEQKEMVQNKKYNKRNDKRGAGYMKGAEKIMQPFDFSAKNRLSLNDMHDMLSAVIFSNATPKKKLFLLTEADRTFLLQYMSQLPGERDFPFYPYPQYWDAFVKFNMFGSEKKSMPADIKSFNKVGVAYGYLTDISYIADLENNIEFLLSATIYTNKDDIFNDDNYDYESVGLPFLKKLGETIYAYEKKRNRKHVPDLSEFKLKGIKE